MRCRFAAGGEANGPNLIIWQVLSTVNRMEMEFGGFIYLAGPPHNTTVLLGKWKYGETYRMSFKLNYFKVLVQTGG